MKPLIAIVGRPNVGKSTLFNRIIGRRQALTLDTSGVTRDRHYGSAVWEGREFLLVDTGGLVLEGSQSLEKKVKEQVDLAIESASIILLVMDGQMGLVGEEREIARYLRRSGKTIFLVVNKIDSPRHEDRKADFFALGDEVYPVSSEHGYRVNDLLDRVVERLPQEKGETREGKGIRIALVGRPNVGKSSLINRLLGEERAVVHEEPGTTSDAIDTSVTISGRDYLLIDTAGIRRGAKSASRLERYSVLNALGAIERAHICLLLLDAEKGIVAQDAHVAGAIQEVRKGAILIWNKWDLVRDAKEARRRYEEDLDDRLRFLAFAPRLFLSAKSGEGCRRVWGEIDRLFDQLNLRIGTSDVNRVFEKLIASHNPPVYRGRPVKFFYATQTSVRPPTFIVFVSEPDGVHFSFRRYLVNGFRKAFGFGGAPIEVLFRKRR